MLAAFPDDLVIGIVLGVLLGIVAGPLLRSWLIWREWSSASRQFDVHASHEADLIADLLDRMESEGWPPADETANPLDGWGHDEKTPGKRWQPRP